MRFYPISYHSTDDHRGHMILIFAYSDKMQEDGTYTKVAIRIRYSHWFYARIDDVAHSDLVSYLQTLSGIDIEEEGKAQVRRSTREMHRTFRTVRVSCRSYRTKVEALSILRSRQVPIHEAETELRPLLKLMADRDVARYCWMEIDGKVPTDQRTTFQQEFVGDASTLRRAEQMAPPPFSHLSFDIETDSVQINKFPTAKGAMDNAIRIICLTYAHGKRYEEHSIVLGPDLTSYVNSDAERTRGQADVSDAIRNMKVVVHTVSTELALIDKFFELVRELDPDFLYGHNIFSFDIPYILDRRTLLIMHERGIRRNLGLPNVSRLADYECSVRSVEWNNSAVAVSGTYVSIPGRMWIDTRIVMIQGLFGNLPDAKLETLGTTVLGMHKDPVDFKDMFYTFQLYRHWAAVNAGERTSFTRQDISQQIDERYRELLAKHNQQLPARPAKITIDTLNGLLSLCNTMNQRGKKLKLFSHASRNELDMDAEYQKVEDILKGCIANWNIVPPENLDEDEKLRILWWIVTKYCLQDTRIPYQALEHRAIIPALREQSSIFSVDLEDILMRGKVYTTTCSQYRYNFQRGFMMDFFDRGGPVEPYEFEGGFVGGRDLRGLVVGEDEAALVMDFASLYPTAIIAKNICYTTWVEGRCREAFLEDRIENPSYIWLLYKDQILRDVQKAEGTEREELQAIIEAPYEKKGGLMCRIFTVNNQKLHQTMVHWFLKPCVLKGVVPDMLWQQYLGRKAVKKQMGAAAKAGDNVMYTTYNAQQLAIKVVMNATYGAFGTRQHRLANFPAAEAITYVGRSSIHQCNQYVEDQGIGRIVYNDTDSAMVCISGLKERFQMDVKKLEAYGHELAAELSSLYEKPMLMEFENIFLSMLVKASKMYTAILCDGKSLDLTDYTRSYVFSHGLLYIKGMAPVRKDKYEYNRQLLRNVLFAIMRRAPHEVPVKMMETAIRNMWALRTSIKDLDKVSKLFSYSLGISAKAVQGSTATAGQWVSIYEAKTGSKPQVGERFNVLVTIGSDPHKHTKSADKLVTAEWFKNERRTLDVQHYIEALEGNGNVVELLHLAYPDDVPVKCVSRWYMRKLNEDGSF